MKNDKNVNDIIKKINNNLEPLNIGEKENNITTNLKENEIQEALIKKVNTLNSDAISEKTNNSVASTDTQNTLVSGKFMEEKDLDLPLFTSTKYTSFIWKATHFITYLIYIGSLFSSSLAWYLKNYYNYNIFLMIAHFSYFFSTLMLWLYYRRGCLVNANHNTEVKANVDKSLKARILRSETGWIHFFSFVGAFILLYSNFFNILIDSNKIINECWNINLAGAMIVSLTQILKIEKALEENRQYVIKNDLGRSLVEIFLFFGSIFFGCSYLIHILYSFNEDNFFALLSSLKFIGSGLIIISGMIMAYRYFCAGKQDLNTSDISNVTE